jgi:protein O-GlcNAc transferase
MNRQQRRAAAKSDKSKPPGTARLFLSAVQHHQAGRLAEAESAYRRILVTQPDHADAAFNLGVALRQRGDADGAIVAYRLALTVTPDYPEAHYNLGNALMAQGSIGEAIAAYLQARRLKVDHAGAAANLAIAYSRLGIALLDQGNPDEATAAFRQAIGLTPHVAEGHYNLGNALKLQRLLSDAATAYRQAIAINPDFAEAHANLGNALLDLGLVDDALAAYAQALRLKPDSPELHYNLGNALKDKGKISDAATAYSEALRLKPDYASAHANLGIVLMGQGRLDEAVSAYRAAVTLKPDDAATFSNLLFSLNYDGARTSAELFAAHREWDERYGRSVLRPQAYANDRAPARRLKVGYVSPDFRAHSVAYFLEPLFANRNREAIELFCYADVQRPDEITARLRGLADRWLSTVDLPDDALAARIGADGIDILVDLAGHTAHNRLGLFARKPAPVQATWLGYANTTGLSAMDYRIVDAVTDPPESQSFASETLLRLPGGFLCYGGPSGGLDVSAPPCLANGFVTFGSFNNPAKVSQATFDVWARLLTQMPDARLLLKGRGLTDETACASFKAQFGERGIAPARIDLVGWLPSSSAHLSLYDHIDIALDAFPYNGTTTTCEALWMGVPVVTLAGDRHAARVGASLLTQAGLMEWIAVSADAYVDIALTLAGDRPNLADLRQSLRARIAASSLCNGKDFALRMEAALRTMWHRWCEAHH